MGMMEKMMGRMMGKMSFEEKEKMMMKMMPQMMGMMGGEEGEGGMTGMMSKMKGMGSMQSGEMKQMMHETMPRMMRECFGHMEAEDRKETLTMCRSMLDGIEREFS